MENYAIELRNITKVFNGKVVANKNVNLFVKKGEILSILGENGSGKTTLMNMISGIYYPDEGQILINGKEVKIRSPHDAFSYKIGMVHQHFKLVDIFSAAENIALGIDKKFNAKDVSERINKIANKYGFEIDPNKKIYNMSVSEKQTVEILKVLYRGTDILILDEPTAVLTPQEIEKLFNVIREMRKDGKSIIIITHKLNEVMEISDRVSILRKGVYIGTVNTSETSEKELTEMMVGKKIDLKIERVIHPIKKPLIEIRNLTVKKDDGSIAVDNVNFYIRGGEIIGIAGVAGCGQKELCEAIVGLRKIESGQIMHNKESLLKLTPKQIIDRGISMSFIPEDRLGMGLCPNFTITDNMMLKSYQKNPGLFVNRKVARNAANDLIKRLEVVTPGSETPIRLLSGGNVQKVLVGREIDSNPNVIITAYPVRGLDINSAYAIYDILQEQKKKDVGILFVGEDLDVMLALCDQIMVLCHGKVMGVVPSWETNKEQLGLMMTGALDLASSDHSMGFAYDSNLNENEWQLAKEATENGK